KVTTLKIQRAVVRVLIRQHIGSAARVINNAVRLKQGGNHNNTLRSGFDHPLKIVDVDSANTEDRYAHIEVGVSDAVQADRLVIRFCWRGEDRTKSDVISALSLRRVCLGQAVRRFTNDQISSGFLACYVN